MTSLEEFRQMSIDDELERRREVAEGFSGWDVFRPSTESEDEAEPPDAPREEARAA